MKFQNNTYVFLLLISIIYIIISIISIDNCYFWDNIQQTSKEAHWFYLNDFQSLIMPTMDSGNEIVATGYHPPLIGIMTAILWNIFGYELWVSHVFMVFWCIFLVYNAFKLIKLFFPEKFVGWVLLIVLTEPTILTQFSIASPDFILFTAFVISVRALLEDKRILLAFGIFFLVCINMRGVFAGVFLLLAHLYYFFNISNVKFDFSTLTRIVLPYIPAFLVLGCYFLYYFSVNGWFFNKPDSTDHYSMPVSAMRIVKHLAEFGLRNIENGRIFIWIIGIYVFVKIAFVKFKLNKNEKFIFILFGLLFSLYLLFVFISNMPFSARYFSPYFFLLSLISLIGVIKYTSGTKTYIIFIAILFFQLTGNFWIYPEKFAKPWDSTLAHLSFYDVRKQCFNYIDEEKIDYVDVSAGFALDGNRRFSELISEDKRVGVRPDSKYFLYSNISNLPDSLVDNFSDSVRWEKIQHFEKGFVFITIYQRASWE